MKQNLPSIYTEVLPNNVKHQAIIERIGTADKYRLIIKSTGNRRVSRSIYKEHRETKGFREGIAGL